MAAHAPPWASSHNVPTPLAGLTVALGPPSEEFLWVGLLALGARDAVLFTFPLFGEARVS